MKITDYLAIYAAILSSLVFFWNVAQSRPRIKVHLMYGIETIEGEMKSGIYVIVRNMSSQDIYLAAINLLYPFRRISIKERIAHIWQYKRVTKNQGWCHTSLSNYAIASGCPMCLEARNSHRVFIDKVILEKIWGDSIHKSIKATVQDQLMNNVYSKTFKYHLT